MPVEIRHQETRKTAMWASSVGEIRWKGKVAQSWLRVKEKVEPARIESWTEVGRTTWANGVA